MQHPPTNPTFACPACRYEVASPTIVRCPECGLRTAEAAVAYARQAIAVRLPIAFVLSAHVLVSAFILLRVAEPNDQGLDLATPLLVIGAVLLGIGGVVAAISRHWSTAIIAGVALLGVFFALDPAVGDPTNGRVQLSLLAMLLASCFTLEVTLRAMLSNEPARRVFRWPKPFLHTLRALAITLIGVILFFGMSGRDYFDEPRYMLICLPAAVTLATQFALGIIVIVSAGRLGDQQRK